MYPVLFEIFGFPISTFGVMLALAFLAGTWLTALRMREIGLDPDQATTMLIYAMVGGIGGAKLYFAVDVSLREGIPFTQLLFAREGITFYGGLIGAITLVILGTRIHSIPIGPFFNCVCLAGAIGQALGRVGCFLVGDDYGRPTDGPFGIAFPQGAPPTLDTVHPTQLYESAWLFAVTAFLWARRDQSPRLWAEYLMLAGIGRFAVEFLRVNPRVVLGMSEAQIIAVAMFTVGALSWLHARRAMPVAAA
ncbi:MAG: diacylglyceryl transferase [Deltaproteobacteria bacterium]|nr:diacylglyceryl transferase [Deltaproteobacteria bacterium]